MTAWINLEDIMVQWNVRHKRPRILQFHSYKMFRRAKSRETESRLVGVRGQGRRRVGTWSLMGTDFQFCMMKTVLEGLPWWLSGKESTCQWRRHRFDPWSRKIPNAAEQLSHGPQLLSLYSRAWEPQLLSPSTTTTEACMPVLHKRSQDNERPAHCNYRVAPNRHN